jgi:hypothetical protein
LGTRNVRKIGERLLDRVGVVHEVEHEGVVLLRMRAVQARERLHRLDPRERLVDVPFATEP